MIDYEKSAELNNCTVEDLKIRFKKFPHSQKKIVAICEGCGRSRVLTFSDYGDLCQICGTIKSHVDHPNMAIESSKRMKENNPMKVVKTVEKMVKSTKKYHENNPNAGKEKGKRLKNSIKHKIAVEKQIGGHDIVGHHIAYDFNNPNAFIVFITRSFHGQIHNPKGVPRHKRGYSLID